MKKGFPARLILEDGTVFSGKSFGFNSSSAGEAVFNTGMVGYPESLTDPSYCGQILVFTYPLIGNYGVPGKKKEFGLSKFFESERIQVKGLVVADYSQEWSHWNSEKSLGDWLKEEKVPAISGVDTRALTKRLREKGTMLGKIVLGKDVEFFDPNKVNLVQEVSGKKVLEHGKGRKKIAVVDCGVKNNIIRSLVNRKVKVYRVPWNCDLVKSGLDFDGVVLSNGPGNPKQCRETIENVKKLLKEEIPIFGICLGNQILALAAGANTFKLKYGHRGQNQPCEELDSGKCFITAQNHGYAIKGSSMGRGWGEWFKNLNDGTNEGIKHRVKPFYSVQFHPEFNPGPTDTGFLFDKFLREVK